MPNEQTHHITAPILAILSIILLYAIFGMLGIGCPIKFITGISCAGCGMTRAYVHLLHGDIAGAYVHHPLFALPPIVILLFVFRKKISRKIYRSTLWTIGVFFLIIYIYRMIAGDDTIVVFKPDHGLIYRIISKFIQ